ncbi:MAG: ATP-binding protein [Muribaculaceae bacterium]|nr:ATP-binding protein [Muribaculaceae bacterium]
MEHLKINNLGPIENVDIEFGDLTFFVGPQASGKSITLEALKLIEDRDSIIETLDRYNYILGHNAKRILNVYFGEGMEKLWGDDTHLELDSKTLSLKNIPKNSSGKESSVFYMPAQRVVCMGDGYPKFFSDFSFTTPYVLREFTETLRTFLQFGLGNKDVIFPINERLKKIQKQSFEDSIFHKGEVVMDEVAGQKKMLLSVGSMKIPFMAWSAGQKEFMPLLLGFYCLSGSPSKVVKRDRYTTVIIEEPEMGLHPKAIISVLLQICELIESGYKVIISTHSSVFIEFAWAFNTLQNNCNNLHEALCSLFQVEVNSSVGKMLKGIQKKIVKTYFFSRQYDNGKVGTRDISTLDVTSDELILSEWGGISEFATRVNNVVSEFYN